MTQRFSEIPRQQKTQEVFNNLFAWINTNPNLAKSILGNLYENRHKLLDDAEVAKKIQEVGELKIEVNNLTQENDELKSENDSLKLELEKLREKIIDLSFKTEDCRTTSREDKLEIDDSFLIAYGIKSQEQLEELLTDPMIAHKYSYSIDNDSHSRLEFVMKIIGRAKQNVRFFLEKRAEYDCSSWREVGDTSIEGVLKWGNPIKLIIRPSDYKKIIFYYPEEKQVLSEENAELWVEDDYSPPRQITLGKVLKFAKISCLYLPDNFQSSGY